MATLARKQLLRQENACQHAKKQIAGVQQRSDEQAAANLPSQSPGLASDARVILTVPSSSGSPIIHPGSDGKEAWCTWKGRQALTLKLSHADYIINIAWLWYVPLLPCNFMSVPALLAHCNNVWL